VYTWGSSDQTGLQSSQDVITCQVIDFSGRVITQVYAASLRGFALTG
jgi:hypothetical protein